MIYICQYFQIDKRNIRKKNKSLISMSCYFVLLDKQKLLSLKVPEALSILISNLTSIKWETDSLSGKLNSAVAHENSKASKTV